MFHMNKRRQLPLYCVENVHTLEHVKYTLFMYFLNISSCHPHLKAQRDFWCSTVIYFRHFDLSLPSSRDTKHSFAFTYTIPSFWIHIDLLWGKLCRIFSIYTQFGCVRLTIYHPRSAECQENPGALTYPEPLGPPRPVVGDLCLYTQFVWRIWVLSDFSLPRRFIWVKLLFWHVTRHSSVVCCPCFL
jgi:hypothetical protein